MNHIIIINYNNKLQFHLALLKSLKFEKSGNFDFP